MRDLYECVIDELIELDSTVRAQLLVEEYLPRILAEMILMRNQNEISKAICSWNYSTQQAVIDEWGRNNIQPQSLNKELPKLEQWRDHLPTCQGYISSRCTCGAYRFNLPKT